MFNMVLSSHHIEVAYRLHMEKDLTLKQSTIPNTATTLLCIRRLGYIMICVIIFCSDNYEDICSTGSYPWWHGTQGEFKIQEPLL